MKVNIRPTSCGGISKEMVRMSTLMNVSVQGNTMKIPNRKIGQHQIIHLQQLVC